MERIEKIYKNKSFKGENIKNDKILNIFITFNNLFYHSLIRKFHILLTSNLLLFQIV